MIALNPHEPMPTTYSPVHTPRLIIRHTRRAEIRLSAKATHETYTLDVIVGVVTSVTYYRVDKPKLRGLVRDSLVESVERFLVVIGEEQTMAEPIISKYGVFL